MSEDMIQMTRAYSSAPNERLHNSIFCVTYSFFSSWKKSLTGPRIKGKKSARRPVWYKQHTHICLQCSCFACILMGCSVNFDVCVLLCSSMCDDDKKSSSNPIWQIFFQGARKLMLLLLLFWMPSSICHFWKCAACSTAFMRSQNINHITNCLYNHIITELSYCTFPRFNSSLKVHGWQKNTTGWQAM